MTYISNKTKKQQPKLTPLSPLILGKIGIFVQIQNTC